MGDDFLAMDFLPMVLQEGTHWQWVNAHMTPAGCDEIIEALRPLPLVPVRNQYENGNLSCDLIAQLQANPNVVPALAVGIIRQSLAFAIELFGLVDADLREISALHYQVGHHQRWHLDENLGRTMKWASATLYLSDPATYTGGELELGDHTEFRPEQCKVMLLRGDVPHRVRAVESGERWAISSFVAGRR